MMQLLRKPLNYILTGTFTIVFAACYGAPVEMQSKKTIKTQANNGNPIPGLKVSLKANSAVLQDKQTDNLGLVDFYDLNPVDKYSVVIEDIDGDANGGNFEMKEITLADQDYYEVEMKIK